jgi:hypothetical protein
MVVAIREDLKGMVDVAACHHCKLKKWQVSDKVLKRTPAHIKLGQNLSPLEESCPMV